MTTAARTEGAAAGRPGGRGRMAAALGLLLAAALVVRIPGLTESIWFDEHYRTFVRMQPENLYDLLFKEVHNFLYNGFMYVWIRIFGDADPVIRIPSLMAGVGASLIFWRWVTRRWGGVAGWLVLAWVLFSPVHVWYSTEAKNNMFSVFFAVCILVSYDRMLERPGQKWWMAAAVASGVLGIFTDFVTVLALVPVVLACGWGVWRRGGPLARNELVFVVALTGLLAAPWVAFKVMQEQDLTRSYLKHFDLRQLYMLLCNYLFNGNSVVPAPPNRKYLAGAAALVVLPLLGLGLWRAWATRPGPMIAAAFAMPLAFFYAGSAYIAAKHDDNVHWIYQERNLLILLHLYGLLLVLGALSLPRRWMRGAAAALVLGVNLTGVALGHTVHRDVPTVSIPNPDWRAIARFFEERAAEEPVVVVSKAYLKPILHYADVPALYRFRPEAPGYLYVQAWMRRHGAGVFYCLDDTRSIRLQPAELKRLKEWFEIEQTWSFKWMKIHRMRPKRPLEGVDAAAGDAG